MTTESLRSAMQDRDKAIDTYQSDTWPHNTNPQRERRERENKIIIIIVIIIIILKGWQCKTARERSIPY